MPIVSSQPAVFWGWSLRGTVQLVSGERVQALAGPYSPPSPPFRAIPNPTNLTRGSHRIFLLTFLSSWRRVNNRLEGGMVGPQAATICCSGRPVATRLQTGGEMPYTSPQP